MKRLAVTIILSLLLGLSFELGRTLQECIDVARLFSNQCGDDATNGPTATAAVSFTATSVRTCSNTGACNTGDVKIQGSVSSCKSGQQLCVSCRDDGGTVKIRVQSNGLPGTCFYSTQDLNSANYDYEVEFNPAVDANNPYHSPTTQD